MTIPPLNFEIFLIFLNFLRSWALSRLATCDSTAYISFSILGIKFHVTFGESYLKQPSRGGLKKLCSENMQQIYRRTSMPECDFNKVASKLYQNHTSAWVFSCKFATFFRTTFYNNTSGGLLVNLVKFQKIVTRL